MHARVFSPHPAVDGSGLGFYETYMNGRRVIGHGGDTNYFHTELGLLEEEGVGFFVSVNTGGKAALVPRHFVRAFMNHYFPAGLPAVKPPADFGARAAKYAGHYRALRHSYTRFEKVFALLGGTTVAATEKNKLVIPELFGDSAQYVEVAPGVVREVGGDRTIAFVEDGAGEVVGMVGQFAFIPFYKLHWYEGSPFHFTLLGLSLLLFLIALVSALRHWKSDKAGPPAARWARRNLGAARSPQSGLRRSLRVDLRRGPERHRLRGAQGPVRRADPAADRAGAHRAGRWSWPCGYGGRGTGRAARACFHTGGVVAAIAFVWFLNYWNLLGYRIG